MQSPRVFSISLILFGIYKLSHPTFGNIACVSDFEPSPIYKLEMLHSLNAKLFISEHESKIVIFEISQYENAYAPIFMTVSGIYILNIGGDDCLLLPKKHFYQFLLRRRE